MRQRPAEYIPQIPESRAAPPFPTGSRWNHLAKVRQTNDNLLPCRDKLTPLSTFPLAAACNVYAPVYLHSEWGGGRGKFI